MSTPPTGSAVMRQFIPSSPFAAKLGLVIEDLGDGTAVLRMPWDPANATMGDTVHGGAVSSLADTAVMAAAWAGAPVPDRLRGATVSLSMLFAGAARGEDLTAHARVVRRGSSLTHCAVAVRGADGRTVAEGVAVYKVG